MNHLKIKVLKFLNQIKANEKLLTITYNSGWVIGDKIIRLLLGVLINAWIARYFGPKMFGTLSYVISFISIFQSIASFGIDPIVVREIIAKPQDSGRIISSAFIIKLLAGIFSFIVAITITLFTYGLNNQLFYLTILIGMSMIFQSSDCFDLWFQSQSQSKKTFLSKLIAYIISNGLKVLCILTKAPLFAFAAIISMEALIVFLSLAYSFNKFPTRKPLKPTKVYLSQLFKDGLPLMMTGLSVAIYMRIDQILIKNLIGDKELGIYSAILPLSTLWQFIPMSLMVSLAPFVTKAKNNSEEAYWLLLEKIFKIFSFLAWTIIIMTIIFSRLTVYILYGEAYLKGAFVLSIHIFTNLFINLGVAQNLWVINDKKGLIGLLKALIAASVSLICNYYFISYYGIIGAAIVAVISQAVSAVFSNILFSKKIFLLQIRSIVSPSLRIN